MKENDSYFKDLDLDANNLMDNFLIVNKEKNILMNWNYNIGNNKNIILNPWYVSGFVDGDGSFQISVFNIKGKGLTGYKVSLEFKVT